VDYASAFSRNRDCWAVAARCAVGSCGKRASTTTARVVRLKHLAACASTAAAASTSANNSPITAILYTRGESIVSWNGGDFAVNNGSYAYFGGEIMQMAAGSIGLLQLSNGGCFCLRRFDGVAFTRLQRRSCFECHPRQQSFLLQGKQRLHRACQ
jgi:hypothetical protein